MGALLEPLCGIDALILCAGLLACQSGWSEMLVSHKKRFIYMKNAKTAGASVEMCFQPYCVPDEDAEIEHAATTSVTSAGIVARRMGHNSEGWSAHMSAEKVRCIVGPRCSGITSSSV